MTEAKPRGSRRVLTATNRHLGRLPVELQDDALCEIARELSRQVDAGQVSAATQLTKVLGELRKLAAPVVTKSAAAAPVAEQEDGPDVVDELARMRADRLAGAAGVVRPIRGDQRRAGGAGAG